MRNATLVAAGVAGCAHGTSPAAPAPDASSDAPAHPHALAPDGPAVTADAALPDAGCSISAGTTVTLDGVADLADYPSAQQLTPGAMLGSDGAALSWDSPRLYITVQSSAFANALSAAIVT